MAYIAPPFTPSVTISGTDLIRNTDEKLQTIANDVGTYLEEETQNAYDDLSLRVTDLETDYNTVLKPEIEAKMDDLLSVNPDGTYYTKNAIDALVGSKVSKVTSVDNQVVRFNGTTGEIQGSGVVVDDSGNIVVTSGFASGGGISFRDGYLPNANTGIYAKDHSGANRDGLEICAYDGFSVITGNPLTERFKIDMNGNCSLGTPTSKLKLQTGTYSGIFNGNNGNEQWLDLSYNVYYNGGYKFIDGTAGQAQLLEMSNGSVGLYRSTNAQTTDGVITFTTSALWDTNGNMGLGVTPKAWKSTIKAIDFLGDSAVTNGGQIFNAYVATSDVWMYKANGYATLYQSYSGKHEWLNAPSGTAGNAVTWTNAMILDASSKLSITGGVAVGNTAVANATTLDWYEEGTFAPIIIGTTTAGTGTYSTQYGRFTRIGDIVHINFRIVWSAHTGTGNISIGGLPFASNAEVGNFATNTLYALGDLTYSGGALGIALSQGLSVLAVYTTPVSTGSAGVVAMDTAATLLGSLTYRV